MLRHLHIQNYALISHLDLDLEGGFSVLTGETGAGKSIILGALNLVMGGRADTKAITDGEDKCIIEAEFDECIVRRELYANGKSRSFVDDSVVTLAELKTLAARLIDIHSQHANLLLENDDFQLSIVDAIAGNQAETVAYATAYEAYLQAQKALHDLQALARKTQADADYIAFRYQTLADAHLEEGEMASLEEEQFRLSHAEEIRTALETATNAIDGEEMSVLELLRMCNLSTAAPELQERIESAKIELRDIADEANKQAERTEFDPERLGEVEERLGLLNTLLRKYNAASEEELIGMRDELQRQNEQINSFDADIARLQKELDSRTADLEKAALTLRKTRESVREPIAQQLVKNLTRLGIAHAKIDIAITDAPDYTPAGKDDVQFMFAANLNQSLRRVSEVASGGEISRIMLCIKALIASKNGLPTIIFDEIDTGVSGEVASQMGDIMQQMASSRQIIAITHLPQIAAKGQTQYLVYKADTAQRTETHIKRLTEEERVEQIATMLSGKHPTPAAIENARQLLANA